MGTRPTFTWGIKRRSLKKRTLCGTRFTVRQLYGGITLYLGQLVIDLYDAATEALVWRGAVSKTINRGKTRETTEKPGEDDRKTSEELSIKDESLGVFCNLF